MEDVVMMICDTCDGTGEDRHEICPACDGLGLRPELIEGADDDISDRPFSSGD
jgi:RecJ-like exonuclease